MRFGHRAELGPGRVPITAHREDRGAGLHACCSRPGVPWRRINGHELIADALDGATFRDGVQVTDDEGHDAGR